MTAPDDDLVDRVRDALAATASVRDVRMFGGRAFLVDEKMVVHVRGDGDLLVRSDPARSDELLTATGARPAEMGTGRAMGKGWISVAAHAVASDGDLGFWIGVALDHRRDGAHTRRGRPGRADAR